MEQARALDCFERAAALGGPRFDLLNDLKLELSFVLLHETLKFVQLLGVDSAWGAAETWTGLCRKSTKLRSVSTEPAAAQAALSESYLALHFRSNFMAPPPSGKTFEVVDVLDLFRKLEWEWDRMRAVSLHDSGIERSYLALNAAMTAWHMTDWLCARFEAEHYKRLSSHASIPIDNCKVFRKWVLENRFVSMCEQIAVAGKHFQVDVRPHAVTTKAQSIDSPFPKSPRPLNYLMVKDQDAVVPIDAVIGFAIAFWRMVLVGTGLAEEHEVKYPMPPRTDTAHKANR